MQFSATLSFWDKCCGSFDPERVINILRQAFGRCDCDEVDHAAADYERTRAIIADVAESSDSRIAMTQQILRKQRRSGPTYHFQVPLSGEDRVLKGVVGRYAIVLKAEIQLSEQEQSAIRTILQSLTLGTPKIEEHK